MTNFSISSSSLIGAPRLFVAQAQKELASAQKEVATGRHDDVGLALAGSVGHTISMRGELSGIEAQSRANARIAQRFSAMQNVLEASAKTGEAFRATLLSGAGSTPAINEEAALSAIDGLVGALNTSFGGRQLFSGDRTDTPAIKDDVAKGYAGSKAEASIRAAWADYVETNAEGDPSKITADQLKTFLDGPLETAFGEDEWRTTWSDASSTDASSRIGENERIASSASANERAFRDVMKSYVMVASLGIGDLNAGARQVLASRSAETLSSGLAGITGLRSRIGLDEERIETTNDALKNRSFVLTTGIGREEEIDVYEAKLRMTSLTNALEASYAATARISRLSLLNFL